MRGKRLIKKTSKFLNSPGKTAHERQVASKKYQKKYPYPCPRLYCPEKITLPPSQQPNKSFCLLGAVVTRNSHEHHLSEKHICFFVKIHHHSHGQLHDHNICPKKSSEGDEDVSPNPGNIKDEKLKGVSKYGRQSG